MMRPRLVLVHGTRFDSRQWAEYAEAIPEAEIVAVDLPGHGTRAGAEFTTDAAVGVVAEAADVEGPVIVAGHSLGGYVATTYAQRRPARVDALVLIGAMADPKRHPVLRRTYTGFARALGMVGAERMARGSNLVMRGLGAAPDDLPDSAGYAALPAAWAATMASADPAQLAALDCPVYLVAGSLDQLRIDTRHYAAACRDPHIRLIPGATHFAPTTHRDQVAGILREAVSAGVVAYGRPST